MNYESLPSVLYTLALTFCYYCRDTITLKRMFFILQVHHPSIFIDFTLLVEIIFLKLGFFALLCMSRIMLPYHEIKIRENERAKREGCGGPIKQ